MEVINKNLNFICTKVDRDLQYSSDSDFKLSFNRELNKIIFHDIYITLSKTDFERRFFKFQINIMADIFKDMQKSLIIRNVFDFSCLNNNVRAQLLEHIFFETGVALKTVPIGAMQQNTGKANLELESFEEKIAEFHILGAKVNVIDEYSFEFLKKQFYNLRTHLYLDLLFQRSMSIMKDLDFPEKKNRIIQFFYSAIPTVLERELNSSDLEKIEYWIQIDKISNDLNSYEAFLHYLTTIIETLGLDNQQLSVKYLINFYNENLISHFFESITKENKVNTYEELSKYFARDFYQNYTFEFIKSLCSKEYTHEWYIPCQLGFLDSSLIITQKDEIKVGIITRKDLLTLVKDLPEVLSSRIKLNDNYQYYFYGSIYNNNLDMQHSLLKVKSQCSEMLDIMYFKESRPFPTKFIWDEAFCIVNDKSNTNNISIVNNGWTAKFSPSLDNNQTLMKIDIYGDFIRLKNNCNNNDLSRRFFYSLNLYRDALFLDSKEDKLLKFWNILEVITKKDKINSIVELSSYFPAIFSNDIHTNEKVLKLPKNVQSEFFNKQYLNYKEIINDIGSLRNEFVAHKNRGISISEYRFERSLNLINEIVLKTQQIVLDYLLSDVDVSSVKDIINDLKANYFSDKENVHKLR